ncbi:MAG: alpha/beta fold hydrolase [Pseudomonadota bacterium]
MWVRKFRIIVVMAIITGCQVTPSKTVDSELFLPPVSLLSIDIPNSSDDVLNQRGTLTVPVNRRTGSAQTIALEFYRFSRLSSADKETPPLFVLRGGPGYEGLGDRIENPDFYRDAIERYTRLTDVVIVGHRGFGTSGATPCPDESLVTFGDVSREQQRRARSLAAAKACHDLYADKGQDMTGYNVMEMADDVVAVADALGYAKIQLKGNSFGSFWGMAIIRRHADRIARATFSALEGPDHTFDRPSAVRDALLTMEAAAATAPRYRDRMPADGLIVALERLRAEAERDPIQVSYVDDDSGESVQVSIDGDGIAKLSRGFTRPPFFRYLMHDWPDDLLRMLDGNFSEAAWRLNRFYTHPGTDNAAKTIIECSSGMSSKRRHEFESDTATAIIGKPPLFDDGICEVWADAVLPMDTSSFESEVPVVLVHGDWDVSTPRENAESVRALFHDHHFVEVVGGSHGAIYEAEENDSAFVAALDQWYATGDHTRLPDRIELPPLDWSIDAKN